MGIFDTLEVRARQTMTASSAADATDPFWFSLIESFGGTSSGRPVNRTTAERMITVAACVTLIAGDLAGLPLRLLRKRKDGGYDEATDHELYGMLKHQPNSEMTSYTWRETLFSHCLKSGASVNIVKRDTAWRLRGIVPVAPEVVRIERRPRDTGPLFWIIGGLPYPAKEILYLPAFSHDGIHGVSPITHFARESIGKLISMEQFISVFFANGMSPTGVIQMPEKMYLSSMDAAAPAAATKPSESFLAALKAKFGNRGPDARSPFVLQGGMTWQQIDSKLVDAQFVEILNLSKLDICGLFKVPPHKIGHGKSSTSYNNTEQENLGYVIHGLMPWINRFEQAAEARLLSPQERNQGYRIKFNVAGLLRGDHAARAALYDTLSKWGHVTTDEIRALEDMNPAPDKLGGRRLVPINMIAAEDLSSLNQPTAPATGQASMPLLPEQRSIDDDLRSIRNRDRIASRYQPLITDRMAAVVSREGAFIKAEIDRFRKKRATRSLEAFLGDFYRTLPAWIQEQVGPTMRSFAEAVQEAAAGEIGVDPGMTSELRRELEDYIRDFARQYADGDLRQLLALLGEDGGADAVEQRLDEWHEGGPSGVPRAEKVGRDQSTTIPSMVAAATFFAAGYGARWAIRGPSTCPYCRSLAGRVVARGQAFTEAGEIEPEGAKDGPMKVRRTRYPALHQGCDCFITWGAL
jgi:HK97 family phage portal protein